MALLLGGAVSVVAATVTATSAPADTGAACAATYTIAWQTPSNSPPDYGATITVTNNASFTIQTWTLSWTFGAGQTIIAGSPYSSTVTQTGTTVTATPGGTFNAVLSPGQSATFGFNADYNGTSNPIPAVSCLGPSEGSGSATLSGSLDPLGANTASWDTNYTDPSIASQLSAAHVGLMRYPGGSYADGYLWQSNSYQGTTDPVDFAQYSTATDSISGGQKFVTVDYGSDTPASAGAWVTQSQTAGQGVSLWEVGNEKYGCWESDYWLQQPPASYAGYVPSAGQGATQNPTCPQTSLGDVIGTQIMANSYAAHVGAFIQAMREADKGAQIGVPWAFGSDVPGAAVPDSTEWNDTLLSEHSDDIGFVDAHYYPFNFTGSAGNGNPDDQQILQALRRVPSLYGEIRATLSVYDPKASVIVGETNVSSAETATVCRPLGALFAAGDALSWLAAGAQSIDWWNTDNDGNTSGSCSNPDFGMFSSSSGGQPPAPQTPYYGYQLASILARPDARLASLPTSDLNDVIAFQSALPGGKTAVAFLNTDTSQTEHVTFQAPPGMSGSGHQLKTWTYSNSSPRVATGSEDSSAVSGGITLAPESMTVLETS
jgi:hypothetical protein